MLLVCKSVSGFFGRDRLSDFGNLLFSTCHFCRHCGSCIGSDASVNWRPQM